MVDDVAADSGRRRKPQIQALELVGFQIRGNESKPPWFEIPLIGDPAALGIGSGDILAAGIAAGKQRSVIHGDLIAARGPARVSTQGKSRGLRVAPDGGITGVEKTGPQVSQARMVETLVGGLLFVGPHE